MIVLTIDLGLQLAAEKALADKSAGAVVVLDPRTGAIRAMASRPTFDPNFFSKSFTSQKEYDELFNGLFSAEKVLSPEGYLVVVTFHSIEDRIVKRFIQARTGKLYSTNRYLPDSDALPIQFNKITRKALKPTASEISKNSRARSAKLRIAKRTNFSPGKKLALDELSVPVVGDY